MDILKDNVQILDIVFSDNDINYNNILIDLIDKHEINKLYAFNLLKCNNILDKFILKSLNYHIDINNKHIYYEITYNTEINNNNEYLYTIITYIEEFKDPSNINFFTNIRFDEYKYKQFNDQYDLFLCYSNKWKKKRYNFNRN